MPLRVALVFSVLFACSALFVHEVSADPVFGFIVEADSLARADEALFERSVEEHAILVGAAVGQLLDIAFELRGQDAAAAQENVDFARRLAAVHSVRGGSDVPASLVTTYEAWTAAQFDTKARAAALEAQAATARQEGDAARDVELLREAEALYASIDDRRAVAINRGTQGVAHWYAGDWDAVRAAYERALEARRAIEDRILEGRTLNGLGSAHVQQAQFESALTWYRQAIALRERTGDTVGLATSLNYASTCELSLGRVARARALLERALPIVDASGDARRQLEVLNSLGSLRRKTMQIGAAVEAYERALELVDAAPEFEATIRINLAGALRQQGRTRESLHQIAIAAETVDATRDPWTSYLLENERGQAYLGLGEFDRALADLEKARDRALAMENEEVVAQAEADLANAMSVAGRHEEALVTARRAMDRAAAAGATEYVLSAAQTATNTLDLMGRHEEVLELTSKVLDENPGVASELLVGLRTTRGNALADMGRYADARRELRGVLGNMAESGRTELAWIPTLGIGDSFETLAPDSARTYYENALASLERHRAATASGAVQTSFLAGQRGDVYQGITHFYAEQALRRDRDRWSTLAFRTAERARARGLLELVTQSFEADDDPAIAALLDQLYALDESEDSDDEERQRIQDELARRFDAKLESTAPWASDADAIVGPAELGATLDARTAALIYAVGEEASYVWAVDRDGHTLEALPGRAALQERIVALRDAMLTPGFGDRALAEQASALHRELIAPVAARLRGKDRLWIVPDGVLFEIPFEVLLADDPGERPNWQRANYLARDHRIGYAPSANLLVALREPSSARGDALLALGDPDFSGLSLRAGTTETLPPLPQSRAEVESLTRLRGGTVTLLGAEATEGRLRAALQEARPPIVHLATHGLVDREEPALTCVALAADSEASEDGYLYTLEILALPLDTELVVLSACDTGRGKLERGEGTVGLTRSFLAAGARRVVASLWPVADASTSALMQRFYEELLDRGRAPDDALARARRELWSDRETAHPYYWAPFVLMGSDAPLPASIRG